MLPNNLSFPMLNYPSYFYTFLPDALFFNYSTLEQNLAPVKIETQ